MQPAKHTSCSMLSSTLTAPSHAAGSLLLCSAQQHTGLQMLVKHPLRHVASCGCAGRCVEEAVVRSPSNKLLPAAFAGQHAAKALSEAPVGCGLRRCARGGRRSRWGGLGSR